MDEPARACDSERLEQYVAGRLDETSRDALEQHVLQCAACAEELQLLAGMRDALSAPRVSSLAWMSGIAAGLVLAVAAGVLWNRPVAHPDALAPRPPAADVRLPTLPDVDVLAKFTPPPYVSLQTRSADSPTARTFNAAMEQYNAGRYDRAAAQLADVVERDSAHDLANLFLGISVLAMHRPGEALAPLTRVIERQGPQTGLARLMLARAYLGLKDVAAARRELETLAAGRETEASQARELLTALPAR